MSPGIFPWAFFRRRIRDGGARGAVLYGRAGVVLGRCLPVFGKKLYGGVSAHWRGRPRGRFPKRGDAGESQALQRRLGRPGSGRENKTEVFLYPGTRKKTGIVVL